MTEEWALLLGSSVTQISTEGRVRELRDREWVLLKPYLNRRTNYLQVSVKYDDARRVKPIHRLVGETFLGPRPEHLETRHLNSDRFDNRLVNLAYGTHSENMRDQVAAGRHYQAGKTHCAHGHPLDDALLDRHGHRRCRSCCREQSRRGYAKLRDERIATGWDPSEYERDRSEYWARRGGNPRVLRPTCKRGHELAGDNLRLINGDPNRRVCRECERIRVSVYRERKAIRDGAEQARLRRAAA